MRLEFLPYDRPSMLPVLHLRDAMEGRLRIDLELPGRSRTLRGWEAQVGRVPRMCSTATTC